MHKPHKSLDAWQLSMKLANAIYRITSRFPTEEKFGLVAQMRRAVVSIPSNIAEGAARSSGNEFRQFVSISRSSLSELDTQLDIGENLQFLDTKSREELDEMLIRIDSMLYKLHKSLRA